MRKTRIHVVAACIATLAVLGCGQVAEEKVAPYTYPAPVKGHYKEGNLGEFNVVDGIAYPATGGVGTVVHVTEKQIASPMLAASACPMTQARALAKLRNSKYLEVTLVHGVSKYFAAGSAFAGSSYDTSPGGRYWSSRMQDDPNRAIGSVVHKTDGSFDFDLPLSSPKVNEISIADYEQGRRSDLSAPKPTEQAVTAAYKAVHDAALKKNLKALLTAMGFDAKQVAAIRGLDGIDADLQVFSDRFLSPGAPGEFTAKAGTAHVRVEGANSKGKKFVNYYYFSPCGDHLVLDGIAENPQ